MKIHSLLIGLMIVGLAFVLAACAEKEAAAPVQETISDVTEEKAEIGTDAFIRHMHNHASQLERLNAALEADDLDAAQTPAYWLSTHKSISGAPDVWQQYIAGMRDAALAVGEAPDLLAARAAAASIAESCAACHTAAGVVPFSVH